MWGADYRSPTIRSVLLGILLGAVTIMAVGGLPLLLKALGLPLLIIPSMLGLTGLVTPGDVRSFTLATLPDTIEFNRPGRYAIYTADWGLLELTEASMQSHSAPWLTVQSLATGHPIGVGYVERGLRPYDTPFASGRPILVFEVPAFGVYQLVHPKGLASIAIVPDYSSGKERALALAMTLELLALAAPLVLRSICRRIRQRTTARAMQDARRRQADRIWRPHPPAGNRR